MANKNCEIAFWTLMEAKMSFLYRIHDIFHHYRTLVRQCIEWNCSWHFTVAIKMQIITAIEFVFIKFTFIVQLLLLFLLLCGHKKAKHITKSIVIVHTIDAWCWKTEWYYLRLKMRTSLKPCSFYSVQDLGIHQFNEWNFQFNSNQLNL